MTSQERHDADKPRRKRMFGSTPRSGQISIRIDADLQDIMDALGHATALRILAPQIDQ